MRRWARQYSERLRGERDESENERNAERTERRERNVIIGDSAAGGSRITTDHVEVIRREDGHGPFPPMLSSPMMPPSGQGTTMSLGSREFDGVRADGRRTTWMIPAGRIGNKLPIEIVSERWHSPELNVAVLTRYADPRSGERIYRLESIKRDEPNAELFNSGGLRIEVGADARVGSQISCCY